jgi:hypothetical protein
MICYALGAGLRPRPPHTSTKNIKQHEAKAWRISSCPFVPFVDEPPDHLQLNAPMHKRHQPSIAFGLFPKEFRQFFKDTPRLKKPGKLANSIFFPTQATCLQWLSGRTEFANRGKLDWQVAKSFWQSMPQGCWQGGVLCVSPRSAIYFPVVVLPSI